MQEHGVMYMRNIEKRHFSLFGLILMGADAIITAGGAGREEMRDSNDQK